MVKNKKKIRKVEYECWKCYIFMENAYMHGLKTGVLIMEVFGNIWEVVELWNFDVPEGI